MYKKILEFWMNEKELRDLQVISPEFREEIKKYLEELGRPEEGIPTSLKLAEAERAMRMLNEISSLRREKAFRLNMPKTASDLLYEGESLPAPVASQSPSPQTAVDSEKAKEEGAKRILVRVLGDVTSFIGADLKTYGPFKGEDVVLLPAQNAEALIKRGVATEIQRKACKK